VTSRGIDVTFLNGHPAVLLTDAAAARELAALVHRANDQRVYAGGLPVPSAAPFVAAARAMVSLEALVPATEPELASAPADPSSLVSVKAASQQLGIGSRAVRKRIAAGSLRAQRVGSCWLIEAKELCR
jgi:excisionase family DNA binding protein